MPKAELLYFPARKIKTDRRQWMHERPGLQRYNDLSLIDVCTLESGIDIGQGITVGPGKLVKKNKHRALNNRMA